MQFAADGERRNAPVAGRRPILVVVAGALPPVVRTTTTMAGGLDWLEIGSGAIWLRAPN